MTVDTTWGAFGVQYVTPPKLDWYEVVQRGVLELEAQGHRVDHVLVGSMVHDEVRSALMGTSRTPNSALICAFGHPVVIVAGSSICAPMPPPPEGRVPEYSRTCSGLGERILTWLFGPRTVF